MKSRKWFALSLVVIAGLLLASCAPAVAPTPMPKAMPPAKAPVAETPAAKPAAPSPTPKPAAEQPRYGGILDRANFGDPPHFDIHQGSSPSEHFVIANTNSGLVRFDSVELDKVVPDLAERWESSPDGTTWTFYLRRGVKWHDGRPFTAEDAKFSTERMAFPKEHGIVSPRSATLLLAVKGVEAPDDNTVRITLNYPSPSFITNAAAGWMLILPKHVIQAKGDMKRDVIGTGAFRFKSYMAGTVVELVRNPEYFLKGRPYLDGIRFFSIADRATAFAAFRTGRAKMTAIGSRGLSHAEAALVKKEMADIAVVHTHPAFMRHLLLLNVTKPPWSDVRVRKAIDLALDRQAAIKINFNIGSIGAAMDPKGAWGIPEEEMAKRPGYHQPKDADIAKAKSLLAEAGYAGGIRTSALVRAGGAIVETLGILAQEQLAKIGINAEVEMAEVAAITARQVKRAFEIIPTGYTDMLDDPDVSLGANYVTGGARNMGGFSDKEINELFLKQAQTLDPAERKKIVRQIQERVLELAPYPVFFWDVYNMGLWKEVRGYKPAGGLHTHNFLLDVWLAK